MLPTLDFTSSVQYPETLLPPVSRFDYLEVDETAACGEGLPVTPVELFICHIAGTMYREGIEAEVPLLKTGQVLKLVREADNPYDERAIRIETEDGFHLGYVPRCLNREPAGWLDCGGTLQASLVSVRDRNGWLKIDIRVWKRCFGPEIELTLAGETKPAK